MTSLHAAEWRSFRGPKGDGSTSAENVPATWDASTNVAWKVKVEGSGWSTPVMQADKLYLTVAKPSVDNAGYSLRTMCVNSVDGSTVWSTEVFKQGGNSPGIHGKNSHASPTPLIHEDRIYVHFGHMGTACLSMDGDIRWKNETVSYAPVHGNGGSPVIHKENLIYSVDGAKQAFIVALNINTGAEVWRFDRESNAPRKFSFTTPLLIDNADGAQVISPGSDVVHSLDPATGKLIWKVVYDGYSVIPKPIYDGKYVYICTGYNTPWIYVVDPTGNGDVTDTHVIWRSNKSIPHTPCLILDDGHLYMVSDRGIATCVKAHTGDVVWQERIGGNYSASPVLAEGRIYFQSEAGLATVIKASTTFEKLGSNDIGERTLASYAVDDGTIYLRSDKHLYKITTN
ncbi:MAG: PQQ-binding-like beta-propeller repeat protein [Pirellulaceae bacterium]